MVSESKQNTPFAQPLIRAASACVWRQGKVLLIKRPEGMWAFPGGKVQPEESPFAAAERELAEETGVTADLQQLVGQFELATPRGRFGISCYTGFYLSGEARASDDAMDIAWLYPTETRGLLLAPNIMKAMMAAQRLLTF